MTSQVYPKSMNLSSNLIILPLWYCTNVLAIYRIISCGVSNTTNSFLNVFYNCPTTNFDIFLLEQFYIYLEDYSYSHYLETLYLYFTTPCYLYDY